MTGWLPVTSPLQGRAVVHFRDTRRSLVWIRMLLRGRLGPLRLDTSLVESSRFCSRMLQRRRACRHVRVSMTHRFSLSLRAGHARASALARSNPTSRVRASAEARSSAWTRTPPPAKWRACVSGRASRARHGGASKALARHQPRRPRTPAGARAHPVYTGRRRAVWACHAAHEPRRATREI